MTIEEWQPAAINQQPQSGVLERLADQCEKFLDTPQASDELNQAQSWCHLDEPAWQPALESLSTEQLRNLAMIFASAEQSFGNWQLGANNPAIWVCRHLKRIGNYPEKDYLRKLKSLSSNRYIPRGKIS
ncbi:MAG: hypothetical protein ACPGYX_02935 [Oceanobacter sp.]